MHLDYIYVNFVGNVSQVIDEVLLLLNISICRDIVGLLTQYADALLN